MRLLDLFCGGGGSARGYAMAGWEVTGVDICPQPHFPFRFIQADALAFPLDGFDAVHASPPCQRFANLVHCRPGVAETYPDLIEPVRQRLIESGLPWVIENVPGSPLKPEVTLCGTQFGRRFRLHRLFETSFPVSQPACDHSRLAMNPENGPGRARIRAEFPGESAWGAFCREKGLTGMPVNGDSKKLAREAISPLYTEYIGHFLAASMMTRKAAA